LRQGQEAVKGSRNFVARIRALQDRKKTGIGWEIPNSRLFEASRSWNRRYGLQPSLRAYGKYKLAGVKKEGKIHNGKFFERYSIAEFPDKVSVNDVAPLLVTLRIDPDGKELEKIKT